MNANKIINPTIIAGAIAGGGIGVAGGFLTKSQRLEEQGASVPSQIGNGFVAGAGYGLAGAGIGVGGTGVASALSTILRKA